MSVTPDYIDVIATNTVNSQTYTIAANQSVQQTQEVVWDTDEFTKTTDLPFVIATYTLMVSRRLPVGNWLANVSRSMMQPVSLLRLLKPAIWAPFRICNSVFTLVNLIHH